MGQFLMWQQEMSYGDQPLRTLQPTQHVFLALTSKLRSQRRTAWERRRSNTHRTRRFETGRLLARFFVIYVALWRQNRFGRRDCRPAGRIGTKEQLALFAQWHKCGYQP